MRTFYKFCVIIIIYALLSIPDNKNSIYIPANNGLSSCAKWWGKFAQNLVKFRITSDQNQIYEYNKHRKLLHNHLDNLLIKLSEPDDPILDSINYHINKLSALVSLVPETIQDFEKDVATWRKLLKYQSRYWDTSSNYANERLFQLIIEGRLAFESALIQSQTTKSQWHLPHESTRNSHTLAFQNLQFKSGDVIAFSSKLKNNSYISFFKELPNVYNHLGSIYVNKGSASVIYIDHKIGLTSVTVDYFMNNIAPNGVILRLRQDIPELLRTPSLPSLAASAIFDMAKVGNFKFDYGFNNESHSYMFDWELISKAYELQGFTLNSHSFNKNRLAINIGNNNAYRTPFEVELDHRFIVAGEWYNTNLLYKNRLLTAATAAILSHQSHNEFLNYFKLPFYRLIKGYSMFVGQLGLYEPIPSGITAQSQLVSDNLAKKQKYLTALLETSITEYEQKHNHKATYLKMLQKANELMVEHKGGL